MTLDERIRAALHRRAGEAVVPPGLYARILERRRRRRRAMVAVPVVATAAVVAFAVAVTAAPGERRPPAASVTPTPGRGPAPLVAVLTGKGPFRLDAATGGLQGQYGPRADTTAVASAHDGVRYAYAVPGGSGSGPCRGSVTVVTFDGDSADGAPAWTTDGPVRDMAFSPDGARLAYVTARAGAGGGCDRAVLHVRTLATGAERTWDDGIVENAIVTGGTFLTHLSWAADGRRLAYAAGVCCAHGDAGFLVLDVTQRVPSSFLDVREVTGDTSGGCYLSAPAFHHDSLRAVRACPSDATFELVQVDPLNGAVTAVLGTVPTSGNEFVTGLASDPSGDDALLLLAESDRPGRLVLWRQGVMRNLPARDVRALSW